MASELSSAAGEGIPSNVLLPLSDGVAAADDGGVAAGLGCGDAIGAGMSVGVGSAGAGDALGVGDAAAGASPDPVPEPVVSGMADAGTELDTTIVMLSLVPDVVAPA